MKLSIVCFANEINVFGLLIKLCWDMVFVGVKIFKTDTCSYSSIILIKGFLILIFTQSGVIRVKSIFKT